MNTAIVNISGVMCTDKIKSKRYSYEVSPGLIGIKMPGNCKYSFINNINLLEMVDEEKRKEFFDEFLTLCHITVGTIVTSKPLADWITKNYQTYYNIEIPVGYGDIPHYHILIKNTFSGSGNTQYLRDIKVAKVRKTLIDKPMIKTKFVTLMRANKRKTDIVDQLIDLIE